MLMFDQMFEIETFGDFSIFVIYLYLLHSLSVVIMHFPLHPHLHEGFYFIKMIFDMKIEKLL